MAPTQFFATCAKGLESTLARELTALGATAVVPGRGGASFEGDTETFYRAALWLRTAVRVLWPVLKAYVHSPEDLYDAVQTVDWSRYMTPEHTLAVDCNVRDSGLTHSHYAALKTKDAICDQFVSRVGRRPSVDTERPMVPLNLHVYRDEAVLSLDGAGESLHKRGYRPVLTRAPLNEALAAGIVLMTGWDGSVPLYDPMCGSGTLAIEGAWIATARPPGLTRRHFAFQGWPDFDVELWNSLRDEARRGVRGKTPATIMGSDIRVDAIHFARSNARAAGVGHLLRFERADIRHVRPPEGQPGILICNPPYGERIGEEREIAALYRFMGEGLVQSWNGWRLFVFTERTWAPAFGRAPVTRTPLFNGRIPCELLEFAL